MVVIGAGEINLVKAVFSGFNAEKGIIGMSKAGDNNGSNRAPNAHPETSLNGFRLDSSQSSWLMDRLEALSEEEKISVAAEAKKLAEQHGSSFHPHNNMDPAIGPEVYGQMKDQTYDRDKFAGANAGQGIDQRGHDPRRQGPVAGGYQAAGNNQDNGQGPDVNARLLQEKIENLEQQLQEISSRSPDAGEQVAHGQEPEGAEHPGYAPQRDPRYQGHQGPHGGPEPEGYPGDHRQQWGGQGAQHYEDEPYGQEWRNPQGRQMEEPMPMGGQQGYGQGYDPHGGQGGHYQGQYEARDHEQNELPQFLAPLPPAKSKRHGAATLVGLLVAVGVVGGVVYNYFGEGVSDIVKGEFGNSFAKQEGKLAGEAPPKKAEAEKAEIVEEKVAVKTPVEPAIVEEKTPVKPIVALSPGDIARDFGVSKIEGVAGEDIPLTVRLPKGNYPAAFMVIKDLPEWAKLNRGRLVNGAWIVSLADLEALKVFVPDDQPGNFKFIMEFVYSAQEEPVQRTVTAEIAPVVITPVKPVEPTEETDVASLEESEDAALIKAPEGGNARTLIIDQALEEKWLERGTRLLRAGDVSAARLAFSHLAEQGSGRGAMAMAMTFDPNQPSSRVVAGIKPDVKRARFWYQRALSLGNEAARDPLRLLENKK